MSWLMPLTTTATQLQRNYKKVVNKAKRSKEPIVVLSNNKPEGVYVDFETFKNLQLDLLKDTRSKTAKGKSGLEELYGSWTRKEAEKFNKVIEEMFEKIDPDMWK